MTKRLSRGNRSRRSCCLFFLLSTILIIIAIAGSTAWLYYNPISTDALHQRVLSRLENISGLRVTYDSADITLARGEYRISNLQFHEPDSTGAPLLTIEAVNASISPWQIITNKESLIKRVTLTNPTGLDILYSSRNIAPGKRTRFLIDSIRKAQPAGHTVTTQLPFDELVIRNIELSLVEKDGILPDINPTTTTMLLTGNLNVKNAEAHELNVAFSGNAVRPTNGAQEELISNLVAVAVIEDTNSANISAKADTVSLTHLFREMPNTTLQATDLSTDIELDLENTDHSYNGTIVAKSLTVVSPEKNFRVNDNDIHLDLDIDYNTSTTLSSLHHLALRSAGADAALSGTLLAASPHTFDLTIHADELDRDYRVQLERFLPEGWDIQANRESVAADIRVRGENKQIVDLDGLMKVRATNLITPILPAPLHNLHGDVHFDTSSVRFVDMTAEYAGARLALDGAYLGEPWKLPLTGQLKINWSAILPLKELLRLHGAGLPGIRLSADGTLKGHGTWQQNLNPTDDSLTSIPEINGDIAFENVSIQHPSLPAPLQNLNGNTRVKGNTIEVENLTGTMRGGKLEVTGTLTGDRYVWRNTRIDAALKTQLNLGQLEPYLTPDQQKTIGKYDLTGTARTQIALKGPLTGIGSHLTGTIQISDVGFTPDFDFMRGRFSGVSGELAWNGESITLTDITGQLNDEDIALQGNVSPQEIRLQIQSDTLLENIEKTFPIMDKYLDMSGNVSTNIEFRAENTDNTPTPGNESITQALELIKSEINKHINNKTYSLNGKLVFNDASIRHIGMPPGRKENGKDIPAGRLNHLNGTVEIKNDTLIVSENATLSASFSDTAKCRISGTMKLRPDDFPELKIKISTGEMLKLDTWALGWGKDLNPPDKPPMTGKKFHLTAEITAPAITFRNQTGGRSRGKLTFDMTQNESPRVTNFQEIVIQGNQPGMGHIVGNGKIESFYWNRREFPRWEASIDAQAMPLETMLSTVFTEPANIRGIYTGNLVVNGTGGDPRSIRGQGSATLVNLELGGTSVIRQIGQQTGRNFGSTQFQTARAATFQIGNGVLSSRDINLDSNGLQLEMRGDYWFAADAGRGIPAKTIDGTMRMRLFKSVLGNIPLIGPVADLADEVTNALLLAFRITGTADNPRVSPVALPAFQAAN